MRAVVLRETGGPEVLVPGELPVPEAGPGQVLVRVEAAAVSAGETRLRAGEPPLPLPAVLGAESVGTVELLGEGADPTLAGARVVVMSGLGSYAEYVAVDAERVTRLPAGLSTLDAVASAAPGALALALLERAELRDGDTALVEGGSGKVGGYLVRHAREAGARVVATAGTAAGRARARDLGAARVLDHTDPDWPAKAGTVDVAFDLVGGDQAGRLVAALTPSGGRLVLYGSLSGRPPAVDAGAVLDRGVRVSGCGGPGWFTRVLGTHYPRFLARLAAGRTHAQPIEADLPLADAAEAHRRLEHDRPLGRIVLRP
jgi:NADPH:quinone reductase